MEKMPEEVKVRLIKSAQAGDTDAFSVLVSEHVGYVEWLADKCLAPYLANGARISIQDVYQEGLVGLIQAINTYKTDSEAAFTTYAYMVIKGNVQKQIKFDLNRLGLSGTGHIVQGASLDDENAFFEEPESSGHSALDDIISEDARNEARERFEHAVSGLTQEEKQVLYMINGIGQEQTSNHKKIAKTLGMSEMMVKKTINSAREKISAALGGL